MTTVESRIAENLSRIRARIDSACSRAGRPSASVRLVAVTKSAALEWIDVLIALGVRDLGESRPQLLLERAEQIELSQASPRSEAVQTRVRWHLIGHLQRNKVRKILPVADWLHSIDSLPLAARLDTLSAELGLRPRLLLEVNVSGEASKDGYSPEQLAADWTAICALAHVEIAGLMTMAPFSEEPENSRATFRQLRELRDRLADLPRSPRLGELSMGMSGDFEVGIEEGATLIRVGTSLFDGLPAQA